MNFFMRKPMQIGHVMVMILVCIIQDHIEIAGINAGLFHTAYLNPVSVHGKGCKHIPKSLLAGTKIQKSGNRHIAADPAGAIQIEDIRLIHIIG